MSCTGCRSRPNAIQTRDGSKVSPLTVTAAAMCAGCRYNGNDQVCTVNLHSLRELAIKRTCPKGKHPDNAGIVKWFVRWHGTPWPIRVVLWFTAKIDSTKSLPECGCIVTLKGLVTRLKRIHSDHGKHSPAVQQTSRSSPVGHVGK